jgi:hypothetical protein
MFQMLLVAALLRSVIPRVQKVHSLPGSPGATMTLDGLHAVFQGLRGSDCLIYSKLPIGIWNNHNGQTKPVQLQE